MVRLAHTLQARDKYGLAHLVPFGATNQILAKTRIQQSFAQGRCRRANEDLFERANGNAHFWFVIAIRKEPADAHRALSVVRVDGSCRNCSVAAARNSEVRLKPYRLRDRLTVERLECLSHYPQTCLFWIITPKTDA